MDELEKAFSTIINFFGRDKDLSESDIENMRETPKRAAKALSEMTKTKTDIKKELIGIIDTSFPMDDKNTNETAAMLTQGPIHLVSLCPHHLLVVEYEAWLSYVPKAGGKVLGLSKLARLAKVLAQRPVLQEQLVADIADVLHNSERNVNKFPSIESAGAAVLLVGHHSCMSCRGIQSMAKTATTELRGVYWGEDFETKFYRHIEAARAANIK